MSTYRTIETANFSTVRTAWSELSEVERALLSPLVRCHGFASIGDLYDHGANTGWAGLTYSHEMADFCAAHSQDIVTMWGDYLEYASELGQEYAHAVLIRPFDGYTVAEISKDIYGGIFDFTADGLCWLFAELAAQKFVDKIEEMEG